jgi:hypothetical protein
MSSNKININLKHLNCGQGLNCSIISSFSDKKEYYSDIWCDLTSDGITNIKLAYIKNIMNKLDIDGTAHIIVPEEFLWSLVYKKMRLELFDEMNIQEIKISDSVLNKSCTITFKNNGSTKNVLLMSNNCSIVLDCKYQDSIFIEYINFLKNYDSLLKLSEKNKNMIKSLEFSGKSPLTTYKEPIKLKRKEIDIQNDDKNLTVKKYKKN